MSRKVFISVLGTGFYGECVYEKEGFQSKETRFIQAATLEMLTEDGTWNPDVDAAYILLTPKARSANWQVENNERIKPKVERTADKTTKEKEKYIGLKNELESKSFPVQLNEVDIPDGMNEQEIWEVFDKAYALLQDGDEMYFDITHAFRYLPMLILVLCNYAKFLRGIKVKAITYGNYEARDNSETPVAPIMDLTSFSALQDWTFSGASFTEMGRIRNLTDSLSSISEMANSKFQMNVQQFNNKLNEWEGQIATCRGNEIMHGKSLNEAKKLIRKISAHNDMPQPLTNILEKIKGRIDGFPEDSIERLCFAIRWCLEFHMVQQGYTLCQESIVTKLCQTFADKDIKVRGKNKKEREKSLRNYWSSILGIENRSRDDEAAWANELKDNREITRALLATDWLKNLRSKRSNWVKNRNQVNHAGFIGVVNSREIIEQFQDCADGCLKFLEQEKIEWPQVVYDSEAKNLFINLSNHPSSMWSEAQKAAAMVYGEIEDMDFPSVPPCAKEDEIDRMAMEHVSKILAKPQDASVIVHVMGEMSLTYRIVHMLKARGIRCVCSTTQRMVTEQDGKKVTEFQFEQFREY